MSHIVTTTNGTFYAGKLPNMPEKVPTLDERQAEACCARANQAAEELGIETRYEVREAASA